MDTDRLNIVGLEGEEVSFETDALAEERENARANYLALDKEIGTLRKNLPYPAVKPYETTWMPDDLSDLQFKKAQNQPYWEEIDIVNSYYNQGDLYSGHIRYQSGTDRYFMESPLLATRELTVGPARVLFINVDDKRYKAEMDAWHYPDKNTSLSFSRNITMANKQVRNVDIVLDRGDSMYASITDNYLRNALKRNKSKDGFQSIIQTIQRKQDDIRSLHKDASFIVQGCAGSGKTMVLLHRLRYLIYNKDIYSEDYAFLVPNSGFKHYIRDIAAKFNIRYGNILSYQGYYRMLLGKADETLSEETGELVFPAEYLSRIYSRAFMQECYGGLFDLITEQTNGLVEYCDEKLNELLAKEEADLAKTIEITKSTALEAAKKYAGSIADHFGIALEEYEHIGKLLPELVALIEKQKLIVGAITIQDEDIVITRDDERVLADEKLQMLDADVAAEEGRIKKASIFTVNSHKKKHQQLIAKRDTYYDELVARIVEEEKKLRAAQAAKFSIIFEGVTIKDVEIAYAEVAALYEEAQRVLAVESGKQQNIMETVATKYETEISTLTRVIEASGDFEDCTSEWVQRLVPAGEQLKECILNGMDLYAAFAKYITDKKGQEQFRDKFKIFARRTDREQQAYMNTLLLNICRKTIKTEFDVKICDVYKHYWYITLYCNYLINGNVGKARPYIFIDEAQDLSPSELELIQKFNDKPIMNLFGDVNQLITSHGISDWDMVRGGLEIHELDENFRNTNQIVDYCNNVLPFRMQKIGVDMECVDEYSSVDHALSKGKIYANATFIVKDAIAADDLKIVLNGVNRTDYTIHTVREAKGLEFKHVIVIDRDMSSNEKYISYTRALMKLTVIHDLPHLSDPNACRIIEGEDAETI